MLLLVNRISVFFNFTLQIFYFGVVYASSICEILNQISFSFIEELLPWSVFDLTAREAQNYVLTILGASVARKIMRNIENSLCNCYLTWIFVSMAFGLHDFFLLTRIMEQ